MSLTTPAYWDCDCAVDNIHSSISASCVICGAVQGESPDIHIAELNPAQGVEFEGRALKDAFGEALLEWVGA